MDFVGTGRRLAPEDVARAAATIGCGAAAIEAVLAVEARGRGFDGAARPVILFEPHVFWRRLGPGPKRSRAIEAGLAWAKWRPGRYPATQDGRYAQLVRAMAIDETAALEAVSWGLGQVLGESAAIAGFASARALVDASLESEGRQLDTMVGYIIGAGLARHLVRQDWAAFARGYNGPRYAEHGYDRRLAAAHAKAAARRPIEADPLADGMLALGDKGAAVAEAQRALIAADLLAGPADGDFGPADGDFGPMTEQAVRAFQRARRLGLDGRIGPATGRALGLTFWG